MIDIRLAVVSCTEFGNSLVDAIREFQHVDVVITADPLVPWSRNLSGFSSWSSKTRGSYKLLKSRERNLDDISQELSQLHVDVLLVCGWPWLIGNAARQAPQIASMGFHGSPFGISRGRGRSPQNWAIILNSSTFELSIFVLDSGIDSGQVLTSAVYPILINDTIGDSYRNAEAVELDLVQKCLASREQLLHMMRSAIKQEPPFEYFPKRLYSDGQIDWNENALRIHNLIRATTRPFPMAFSELDNENRIHFVTSRIISTEAGRIPPGTILGISGNTVLISTGSGIIQSRVAEDINFMRNGMVLKSASHKQIGQEICRRHLTKYPKNPISREVLQHFGL